MLMRNIYDAKTHLSELIQRALNGQEIVISKAGKPLVKLVPIKEKSNARKPGCWAGKIEIADDFDEPPEEILKAFNGET